MHRFPLLSALRHRPRVALVFAYAALITIVYGFGLLPLNLRSPVSDVAELPVAALAAWWASRNASNASLDPRSRRAWRWVSIAATAWMCGTVAWAILADVLGQDPFPSVADVGYIAFYPSLAFALISFPGAPERPDERRHFWFDSAAVVLAGIMALWHFVIAPTAATLDASITGLVSIAYPAGDLCLLIGIGFLIARSPRAGASPAQRALFLAVLVFFAADLAFAVASAADSYQPAELIDAGWVTALALLAAAPALASDEIAQADSGRLRLHRIEDLTPYIALAAGTTVMLAAALPMVEPHVALLLVAASGLVALVEARHLVDSAERRRAEWILAESESRFRALFDGAPVGILINDGRGRIRIVNHTCAIMIGAPEGAFAGMTVGAIVEPAPDPSAIIPFVARRADGTTFPVRSETVELEIDGEHVEVTFILDASGEVGAAEALAHEATHDTLTGLFNRAAFTRTLERELELAGSLNRPTAVVFIDLDSFKEVNDELGHAAGDILLMEVADRLLGALRAADTVARLGGDEFAILLPGADVAGARTAAETVLDALRTTFVIAETPVTIGASLGIAATPDTSPSESDVLMAHADAAMYRAKKARAGIGVFESLGDDTTAGYALLGELRSALEHEEFELFYQPWLAASGAMTAVEALIRWRHPERGLVPPVEFLPLAERVGLMRMIDRYVIDRCVRQARLWADRGMTIRIAINVSRDSFADPDFPDFVGKTLAARGVAGGAIELEITETGVLDNPERARRHSERLAALGIRLALDDFGTGYSSLSRLKALRVATLKIDQGFVREAISDPDNAAIVETVVGLARRLALDVVAEGVEDAATLTYLQGLGVDYAQGYHIARPAPVAEIELLLEAMGERIASDHIDAAA